MAQNISFVNSIATTKGGQHVNVVTDQIVKRLEEVVNKKNKGGLKVKAHQIKNHCWIFVKSQIENPAFDSQTKENMTLAKSKHGSKLGFLIFCNRGKKFAPVPVYK